MTNDGNRFGSLVSPERAAELQELIDLGVIDDGIAAALAWDGGPFTTPNDDDDAQQWPTIQLARVIELQALAKDGGDLEAVRGDLYEALANLRTFLLMQEAPKRDRGRPSAWLTWFRAHEACAVQDFWGVTLSQAIAVVVPHDSTQKYRDRIERACRKVRAGEAAMTFNIKPDSLAGYAHAFRPGSRWIVLGGMIDENGFVDDDASKA